MGPNVEEYNNFLQPILLSNLTPVYVLKIFIHFKTITDAELSPVVSPAVTRATYLFSVRVDPIHREYRYLFPF